MDARVSTPVFHSSQHAVQKLLHWNEALQAPYASRVRDLRGSDVEYDRLCSLEEGWHCRVAGVYDLCIPFPHVLPL